VEANNHNLRSFINGEFVKGKDGKTFETINPSTEKPICSVHEATEKDVDIAVAAARKAFEGPWSKVTPSARGQMLMKLADLMDEHVETLAAIETLDNGKAISMAKVDVALSSGCIRYYAGYADKIHGKVIDTDSDSLTYTRHEAGMFNGSIDEKSTDVSSRCLRSNHPMELPPSHVVVEDRPCCRLRQRRRPEDVSITVI
jgi:hypothetical protein